MNLVNFVILLHQTLDDYVTVFQVYEHVINADKLRARIADAASARPRGGSSSTTWDVQPEPGRSDKVAHFEVIKRWFEDDCRASSPTCGHPSSRASACSCRSSTTTLA
jgi:hypothetical protein